MDDYEPFWASLKFGSANRKSHLWEICETGRPLAYCSADADDIRKLDWSSSREKCASCARQEKHNAA